MLAVLMIVRDVRVGVKVVVAVLKSGSTECPVNRGLRKFFPGDQRAAYASA